MTGTLAALFLHDLVHADDVVRVAHERERDEVGTELETPAQVVFVLLGQRRNVDGDTGQVDALVVRHRASNDDLGRDDGVSRRNDLDLDLAVVDQQEVTRGDVFGQPLEGRAADLAVTDDVFDRDLEDVADGEVVRAVLELAETDLGTLKVDQHRDRLAGILSGATHVRVDLFVHVVAAVAEVHAGNVDTGIDDRPDVLVARRGRAECRDDFCASHVFL